MKSVRGCTNQECGSQLMAVCRSRSCHTFLDNPDGIYCARCLAKRKDSADHAKKNITAIGGGLLVAGSFVAKNSKTIISVAAKAIKFLPK